MCIGLSLSATVYLLQRLRGGLLRDGTPFQDVIRVYNQPIFFPNNGASNPPAGVIPVPRANALANSVAVATAQAPVATPRTPAATVSTPTAKTVVKSKATPPRVSAPILSPLSKLAQLKATRSGLKASGSRV